MADGARPDNVVPLPSGGATRRAPMADRMAASAREAADFLKALGHESRLLILCHLAEGERSVSELEGLMSMRQPAVSQQLMRLRQDGYVDTRRDGKVIHYRIADPRVGEAMALLHRLFCEDGE